MTIFVILYLLASIAQVVFYEHPVQGAGEPGQGLIRALFAGQTPPA